MLISFGKAASSQASLPTIGQDQTIEGGRFYPIPPLGSCRWQEWRLALQEPLGNPAAHNLELLSLDFRLHWGIVAWSFGLLGLPFFATQTSAKLPPDRKKCIRRTVSHGDRRIIREPISLRLIRSSPSPHMKPWKIQTKKRWQPEEPSYTLICPYRVFIHACVYLAK